MMQEDFLHYIWKHNKFDSTDLKTADGEIIKVLNFGQHNHNSGPDFFNAQVLITNQRWAGNVEIHIKSSDWYLHNHEKDRAYDNVILHVVWEHDTQIFRKDNSEIPTLELKNRINSDLLHTYQRLMQSKGWINCEADFASVDSFVLNNWLERLYVERLERKQGDIEKLLANVNYDWEAVLFRMLTKNFGLKINGEAFMSLANSIDFSIIRKLQNDVADLEALFFGQTNLLEQDHFESYYGDLQKRYLFLKQKFSLTNQGVLDLQFFRLRPPNFPTIRLSQLAGLYSKHPHLFSKVIEAETKADFYELFKVESTEYWKTHYTFLTASKPLKKQLTKAFIDLLIVNTIIPIKFSYAKANSKLIEDEIFTLIKSLNFENNSITTAFLKLKPLEKNASTSQSLIQLKLEYCDKNKCLQCAVGNSLIVKN